MGNAQESCSRRGAVRRLGGLVVVSLLVVAACGSDNKSTGAAPTATAATAGTAAIGATAGTAATAATDGTAVTAASTNGEADFAAMVTQAKAALTAWPGATSPVTPPTGSKLVYVITCSSLGIGCVRAGDGVTEAGNELGWKTEVIDGKGDPAQWNAGVRTAIDAKADGIVLAAVPPALVGDGLQAAKSAGIPVISLFVPVEPGSVTASVKPDHRHQGEQLAAFVAENSGGNAQIVVIEDKEFPELVERVDGFRSEIAKCPGCKIVDSVDSQIATFVEKLPGAIVSSLQRNTAATYVVAPFDSNATFAVEGVRQAGLAEKVAVVGYEGDPQSVAAIAAGAPGQIATIANPPEWMGWQAVDELLRAMAGQPPTNIEVRSRLITKDNAPTTKGWLGDVDFKAEYRKLWGLG